MCEQGKLNEDKEMNKQREILIRRQNHQDKCCEENYLGILLYPMHSLSLGPVPWGTTLWCPSTYFLWNRTTGSSSRSVKSSFLPFSMTSWCLRTNSHPMWEKKKPRRALWGSASVSEYLWWTRWSLAHSKMSFCRGNADPEWRDKAPWHLLESFSAFPCPQPPSWPLPSTLLPSSTHNLSTSSLILRVGLGWSATKQE